jgi:hypothetical protein
VKVVERPCGRSGLREPFAANTGAATGARRTATLEVRRSDKDCDRGLAPSRWRTISGPRPRRRLYQHVTRRKSG